MLQVLGSKIGNQNKSLQSKSFCNMLRHFIAVFSYVINKSLKLL